jgi:hypothetical protein
VEAVPGAADGDVAAQGALQVDDHGVAVADEDIALQHALPQMVRGRLGEHRTPVPDEQAPGEVDTGGQGDRLVVADEDAVRDRGRGRLRHPEERRPVPDEPAVGDERGAVEGPDRPLGPGEGGSVHGQAAVAAGQVGRDERRPRDGEDVADGADR